MPIAWRKFCHTFRPIDTVADACKPRYAARRRDKCSDRVVLTSASARSSTSSKTAHLSALLSGLAPDLGVAGSPGLALVVRVAGSPGLALILDVGCAPGCLLLRSIATLALAIAVLAPLALALAVAALASVRPAFGSAPGPMRTQARAIALTGHRGASPEAGAARAVSHRPEWHMKTPAAISHLTYVFKLIKLSLPAGFRLPRLVLLVRPKLQHGQFRGRRQKGGVSTLSPK